MRTDETDSLIENQKKIIKMTKAKTVIFLVMTVATFAVVFSLTDAYPTTESPEESDLHLSNNSRLVITNVVKTIEFEVGVLEDDGNSDENLTDPVNGTDFYETDIRLLNLDLLKEVVSKAEESSTTTTTTAATTTMTTSSSVTED